MPTYTTTTQVEAILPTLPASITSADKARWIADASGMVDEEVGRRYPVQSTGQKFADISDSPATPVGIELCARWYAAYFAFLQLREINKSDELNSRASTYFKLAQNRLKMIRQGEIPLHDSTGAELDSTEQVWSSTEERDATFDRGEYIDGDLQSDEAGSLDDFAL